MPALLNQPSTVLTSPTTTATTNAVQKSSTVTLGRSHAVTSTTTAWPDEGQHEDTEPAEPDRRATPAPAAAPRRREPARPRRASGPHGSSAWKPDSTQSHSHTAGTITSTETTYEMTYVYHGRLIDSRANAPATCAVEDSPETVSGSWREAAALSLEVTATMAPQVSTDAHHSSRVSRPAFTVEDDRSLSAPQARPPDQEVPSSVESGVVSTLVCLPIGSAHA